MDDLLARTAPLGIRPLPAMARFMLQARPATLAGVPLGIVLPPACRATEAGGRAALWLGPGAYLLRTTPADGPALAAALEQALAGQAHALVEVSDRLTALELAGEEAAAVLNAGCPLDLDLAACPVGFCARSVLGKAGILLWRTGAARFLLEIERSFTPYVHGFLAEAGREFGG